MTFLCTPESILTYRLGIWYFFKVIAFCHQNSELPLSLVFCVFQPTDRHVAR